MARPRDATKTRLYAAEDGAAWPEVARRRLSVPYEAQTWVRRIVKRKAIQRRFRMLEFPFRQRVVVERYTRLGITAADANVFHNRIRVREATITAHLLVHELAHLLTPSRYASHGREYRQTYLTLTRYALGAESARALRAAFRKAKLPYRAYRARPALAGRRLPLAARVAASLDSQHAVPPNPS